MTMHHDQPITVRRFQPSDAEAIVRFWSKAATLWPDGDAMFPRPPSVQEALMEWREGENAGLWLAWVGDEIGAYCNLTPRAEESAVLYLGTLSGHPNHLRQGLSRRLMCQSVRQAYDEGKRRLDLDTWHGNEQAIPLYKRTGFNWGANNNEQFENAVPGLLRAPVIARWFGSDGPFASVPDPFSAKRRVGSTVKPGRYVGATDGDQPDGDASASSAPSSGEGHGGTEVATNVQSSPLPRQPEPPRSGNSAIADRATQPFPLSTAVERGLGGEATMRRARHAGIVVAPSPFLSARLTARPPSGGRWPSYQSPKHKDARDTNGARPHGGRTKGIKDD